MLADEMLGLKSENISTFQFWEDIAIMLYFYVIYIHVPITFETIFPKTRDYMLHIDHNVKKCGKSSMDTWMYRSSNS